MLWAIALLPAPIGYAALWLYVRGSGYLWQQLTTTFLFWIVTVDIFFGVGTAMGLMGIRSFTQAEMQPLTRGRRVRIMATAYLIVVGVILVGALLFFLFPPRLS